MLHRLSRIAWLTSAVLLFIGIVLVFTELSDYSLCFFVAFPFAVGFAVVINSENAALITRTLLFVFVGLALALILAGGLGFEGLICILLALPFLAVSTLGGALLGLIARKTFLRKYVDGINQPMVLALPIILLLAGNAVEVLFTDEPKLNTITTSTTLPYAAVMVFDGVKSMDTLRGEKPFLLKWGLPTPNKCVLDADEVDAHRTCIFDQGHIVAQVSAFEPGILLSMQVTEYTLPGFRWFSFRDAAYTFQAIDDDNTRITRVTTYTSTLKPRMYWLPLEKLAINQEHIFVLNSLERNLKDKD